MNNYLSLNNASRGTRFDFLKFALKSTKVYWWSQAVEKRYIRTYTTLPLPYAYDGTTMLLLFRAFGAQDIWFLVVLFICWRNTTRRYLRPWRPRLAVCALSSMNYWMPFFSAWSLGAFNAGQDLFHLSAVSHINHTNCNSLVSWSLRQIDIYGFPAHLARDIFFPKWVLAYSERDQLGSHSAESPMAICFSSIKTARKWISPKTT